MRRRASGRRHGESARARGDVHLGHGRKAALRDARRGLWRSSGRHAGRGDLHGVATAETLDCGLNGGRQGGNGPANGRAGCRAANQACHAVALVGGCKAGKPAASSAKACAHCNRTAKRLRGL